MNICIKLQCRVLSIAIYRKTKSKNYLKFCNFLIKSFFQKSYIPVITMLLGFVEHTPQYKSRTRALALSEREKTKFLAFSGKKLVHFGLDSFVVLISLLQGCFCTLFQKVYQKVPLENLRFFQKKRKKKVPCQKLSLKLRR